MAAKRKSVRFSVTLPASEVDMIRYYARKHERTFAAQVRYALRRYHTPGGAAQQDQAGEDAGR